MVYEKVHLWIKHYALDIDAAVAADRCTLTQEIDILYNYDELNEERLELEPEDMIEDMRFRPDNKEVRLYIT
mgnify:CR=1 FL=1